MRRNFLSFEVILLMFFAVVLLVAFVGFPESMADPTGVDIVFNQTETPLVASASELTTAGGTFTTLVLNGTFQNPRWKAYVGNVTGSLALADGSGSAIYDWTLTSVSGGVYVSRNDSIDWSTIGCAAGSTIEAEESFLNMSSSSADSINNTFNETAHRSFFVGAIPVPSNTCRAIATYINNSRQGVSDEAMFQEILLEDASNNVVYVTLLENALEGYDGSLYDFQMIVPEDSTKETPTTYFFYAEIS